MQLQFYNFPLTYNNGMMIQEDGMTVEDLVCDADCTCWQAMMFSSGQIANIRDNEAKQIITYPSDLFNTGKRDI